MPENVRAELRDLIASEIGSIAQLELLLLLQKDPGKEWSAEEAARALYTATDATVPLLENFHARGFAELIDPPPRYRYAARTPELDQLVKELAALYEERRVTVINLIYAAPDQKLRSFSDAFRIRKPKPEDEP